MRFEVILQSSDDGSEKPFPGCEWNAREQRWEKLFSSFEDLLSLVHGLGFSVRILSNELQWEKGDLPILEIRDKEEW